MTAAPTVGGSPPGSTATREDPRRWITLAIIVVSAFIVVLDNTVLNVSIPTMLRDLHTNLPSLEQAAPRRYELLPAS